MPVNQVPHEVGERLFTLDFAFSQLFTLDFARDFISSAVYVQFYGNDLSLATFYFLEHNKLRLYVKLKV